MFQDPLTAVMAMLLLCFMGIVVMFLFFIRSLSSQAMEMREAFLKQQVALADVERHIMDLSFSLRKKRGEEGDQGLSVKSDVPKNDNADSLISMGQADLLSLLEAANQQKTERPRLQDRPDLADLPDLSERLAPSASRSLSEEYDPATDPHLFDDSLLPENDYPSYRPRSVRTGRRGSSLSLKLDE